MADEQAQRDLRADEAAPRPPGDKIDMHIERHDGHTCSEQTNASCDPSGNGEGQSFLGSANVMTVGNDAAFNVNIPVPVPPSDFITVTATDPAGNTSEFSKCFNNAPGTLQFSAPTYSVSESSPQATITVTRNGGMTGAVSVQYATTLGGTAFPSFTPSRRRPHAAASPDGSG